MPRSMELALIENLQRKDLSAFEEADGLKVAGRDVRLHAREDGGEAGQEPHVDHRDAVARPAMPEDVRELCRLADIHSKSLLLQIVRQSAPRENGRVHRAPASARASRLGSRRAPHRERGEEAAPRTAAPLRLPLPAAARRPSRLALQFRKSPTCRATRSCARCSRSSTSCVSSRRNGRSADAESSDSRARPCSVASQRSQDDRAQRIDRELWSGRARARSADDRRQRHTRSPSRRERVHSAPRRATATSARQKSGATISRSLL